ncbi:MAG: hypothetical protein NXH85_04240 [Pseudomonadaceae bacterium]|nr:hypothetical protein [Pseudomonadaceae bacterium]
MAIVVEIRSSGAHGASRYRFSDDALARGVTIGRGYHCDVMLDDPHVASEELRLVRTDAATGAGSIELELLGDGVVRLAGQQLREGASVPSGTQLKLGRTSVSLFDETHTVPPTTPLDILLESLTSLASPVRVLLAGAIVYLLLLSDEAASQLAERDWLDAALSAFSPMVLAVLWSAVWALVTRVLRHEARFLAHLLVALTSLALSTIMGLASELAQFNSQDPATAAWLDPFLLGLLLCFALVLHVRITAGPMRWYGHGVIVALAWAFVGYGVLEDSNRSRDFQAWPEYSSVLLPPEAYLGTPQTLPEFLDGVGESFDRAAESRTIELEKAIDDGDASTNANTDINAGQR